MSIIKAWKQKEKEELGSDLDKFSMTLYELLGSMIVFWIVELIVGLLLVDKYMNFILGMIVGIAMAIFSVWNMYISIPKIIEVCEEQAQKVYKKNFVLRMFIVFSITVLVVCNYRYINAIAMFIAVFNLKIAVYVQPFVHKYVALRFNFNDEV